MLAYTVCHLFPDTQLLSGGVNEFGFYYDFVIETPIDSNFVVMLEENMRAHAKEDHLISRREMMRENAADFFAHRHQPLKAELILAFPYNIVQLIEFAGFLDVAPVCHTASTADVDVFKLYDVEKIYFHSCGEGRMPALRITGEVFSDKQGLKKFVRQQKAENERGHRILVGAMELFAIDESVSELSGCWQPKGAILREILLGYWSQELQQAGVSPVITPQLVKRNFLRKTDALAAESGLLEVSWEEVSYGAPQTPAAAHACLFKSKPRQVHELPIRYAEVKEIYTDTVLRTRLSGLLKTPSQLIDFMHCFCAAEQLYGELISSLQFIDKMVNILGLRCQWYLCSRREKSAGTPKQWDRALTLMRQALETCGCTYEEDSSQAARHGPLLKGNLRDLLGRHWCGPQVAVDFHLPANLELYYVNAEGQKVTPFLLRQTTFGPLERLIALLIEKDGGVLPLWLAPEQVRVIGIGDGRQEYAGELLRQLQQAGVRATGDLRSNSLGCPLGMKIHECECAKVPYALIVGDNEERENNVNVRKCGHKATSLKMSLSAFLQKLQQEPTFSAPRSSPDSQRATETINRSRERVES